MWDVNNFTDIGRRYFKSSCDICLQFSLVTKQQNRSQLDKFSHDFYENVNMLAVLC